MKKKEGLFYLIKSLTRAEKRYFKIFAGRDHRNKAYLKLFEAIDKQDAYNDTAIRHRFRHETFVNQLHVLKNYLRHLILKSIRNFHSGISKANQVREILTNTEILYNKELYALCEEEIGRAERIARSAELSTYLIEILEWRRRIQQNRDPNDFEGLRDILVEQSQALQISDNLNKYLHLIADISSAMQAESEEKVPLEEWLEDESHALSTEARVMHHNSIYFRSLQRNQPEIGEKSLRRLLGLFEQDEGLLKDKAGMYISTINNLVTYYVFEKYTDQAMELIQKAKATYDSIPIKSENRALIRQMLRTYNIELEVYRDNKMYHRDPDHIRRTEEFVGRYRNKMPREYLISFWFQLANIRFMQGEYSKGLHWANNIIQTNFRSIRPDIQIQARFLNLMIHLENNNMFVLRYFVDSTRRFTKKRKTLEKYEAELLRFFSKMGRTPLSDYRKEYQQTFDILFPKDKEALVPDNILDYINYRDWLHGKISV